MHPLPDTAEQCLNEAMLLAPALIGSIPGAADSTVRVREALAALPDPNTSVQLCTRRGGAVVGQDWIEVRPDGSGRHHDQAPPGSEHWPVVAVDEQSTPASDRFAALVERAAHLSTNEPTIMAQQQFLAGARATLSNDSAAFRAAVREQASMLLDPQALAGPIDLDPFVAILGQARQSGQADGCAAAELIAVLQLAVAVGNQTGLQSELIRYLNFGCLQVATGTNQLGPVLAKAVREDHTRALDAAAAVCLAEGNESLQRALGVTPATRLGFTKYLYDGWPSLMAARLLAGTLVDLLPGQDGPWRTSFRVADERCVRFADGMFEQWNDRDGARLSAERAQVMAAQAVGDRRTVRRILAEGEEALRRPRGVRPFLEGESMIEDVNVEDAGSAIADELGADLTYLAPAGEQRFDPATLAVIVGVWVLKSVAAGVAEGLKESGKDGTVAALKAIGAAIRRRVHHDVPIAMNQASDDVSLDTALDAAKQEWTGTQAQLSQQQSDQLAGLARTAAAAAADGLRDAGLPDGSATRVSVAIETQVGKILATAESAQA